MKDLPLIGIAALASGQGKTRLILSLLEEFSRQGIKVAILKHGQHVQWPEDKDSSLFMQAGAAAALLVTPSGWMLSAAPEQEPSFALALKTLTENCPADLVLTEGYKNGPQPKLLLTEHSLKAGQVLPHTVALISEAPQNLPLPRFKSTATKQIADFIIKTCPPKK
jgi:molybdopterin-guanine dinucleotide biosynthesis protein MobB